MLSRCDLQNIPMQMLNTDNNAFKYHTTKYYFINYFVNHLKICISFIALKIWQYSTNVLFYFSTHGFSNRLNYLTILDTDIHLYLFMSTDIHLQASVPQKSNLKWNSLYFLNTQLQLDVNLDFLWNSLKSWDEKSFSQSFFNLLL